MAIVHPSLSIIILKVNGINFPVKDTVKLNGIKKPRSNYMLCRKNSI